MKTPVIKIVLFKDYIQFHESMYYLAQKDVSKCVELISRYDLYFIMNNCRYLTSQGY